METILTSELNLRRVAVMFVLRALSWTLSKRNIVSECAKIAMSVPPVSHPSRPSSPVTSLESTGTTVKESGSHRNERAHHFHDRKKREWITSQQRPCSSWFSTSALLFVANWPSIENFTAMFCAVKATESVARYELDSTRRQYPLSPSTLCSWISRWSQYVGWSFRIRPTHQMKLRQTSFFSWR